ncbi:MAG: transketolase [candidate division NC10 bacterium]|nr:transketolase [candidate division NC10 bacterium]
MAHQEELDQLCINTIRMLAADAVQKAKSGHPGMPMGAAAMAYVLWARFLKHNPANPKWPDRDRFVLSAGHGCMLQYALLHLTGYGLSLEDIRSFRQWESKTPGHPEYGHTPGVETSTGPLGQGVGNGIGMAIAERWLAAQFNRPGHTIVDHYTYAIVSDGDLMEGVASEGASLAGHLKLGKLIYLYDDNRISIEGSTELAFTEDVGRRFEAYGWHVQRLADGNDLAAVEAAIRTARAETSRPSLIIARTHIGYGSPNKQDSHKAHGEPLGEEEVKLTKQKLGWPSEPAFFIPEEARQEFRTALDRGRAWEAEWRQRMRAYAAAFPQEAARWDQLMDGKLPDGWDTGLPTFAPGDPAMATRAASGKVLQIFFSRIPNLMGGSADLAPSTNTYIKEFGEFPTHQPIEHLMALRAIPHLTVIRPADANETVEAWRTALAQQGPTCLVLTRQNLPVLDRSGTQAGGGVERGAYVLSDPPTGKPQVILIATGSEVSVAMGAQKLLVEKGVAARVVSMPSWEIFERQLPEYRASVLPSDITARVAVEAGSPLGWYKYVGTSGTVMGMTRFGASAPGKINFEMFGFTPENVAARALAVLGR